jgi:hypothetical protein
MSDVKLWRPAIAKLVNKGKRDFCLFEYEVADPNDKSKYGKTYRFDAISFNPFRISRDAVIRGIETKSSRADFVSDKKWMNYLSYCHFFAFMCQPGVIKKEELPLGVGLFYISPVEVNGKAHYIITKEAQWNKREVSIEHRAAVSHRLYSRAVSDLFKRSSKEFLTI